MHRIAVLLLLVILPLAGCSSRVQDTGVHHYAMDGPPLEAAGDLDGLVVEGTVERTCLAGVGEVHLRYSTPDRAVECASSLDAPPNEKGRVKGLLTCSDGSVYFFTMRNLGPDQGFAVGRNQEGTSLLTFFYHPSRAEAERRLPQILADIAAAMGQKDQ